MKTRIVIDGGTTNLRVYLLDVETEQILSAVKVDGGVRHTAEDGHNGRLKSLLQVALRDALKDAGVSEVSVVDCTAYGMITSGLGLVEIPHLVAPVTPADLADGMITQTFSKIISVPIRFIPGVRNFSGVVTKENCSGMDMMRGEETEAIGLWSLLQPKTESVFVLPGSHNKFVRMDAEGRILGCMTSISGELLDAITYHTILSDAVEKSFLREEDYDAQMVCAGAAECKKSGLGRAAFAGRILKTLGKAEARAAQNWLLGAVLAEDVNALRTFAGISDDTTIPIYVAGKAPVQRAFLDVLTWDGCSSAIAVDTSVSKEMGIKGALAISGLAR